MPPQVKTETVNGMKMIKFPAKVNSLPADTIRQLDDMDEAMEQVHKYTTEDYENDNLESYVGNSIATNPQRTLTNMGLNGLWPQKGHYEKVQQLLQKRLSGKAKEISGTAVSETEYNRLRDMMGEYTKMDADNFMKTVLHFKSRLAAEKMYKSLEKTDFPYAGTLQNKMEALKASDSATYYGKMDRWGDIQYDILRMKKNKEFQNLPKEVVNSLEKEFGKMSNYFLSTIDGEDEGNYQRMIQDPKERAIQQIINTDDPDERINLLRAVMTGKKTQDVVKPKTVLQKILSGVGIE